MRPLCTLDVSRKFEGITAILWSAISPTDICICDEFNSFEDSLHQQCSQLCPSISDAWSRLSQVSRLRMRPIKPISQLRFDYDAATIRRYHDAFDYDGSDRNYDMRSIPLRYDNDTTSTKNWHVHFLLSSNRVEWKKEARAIRRSRIVVESQL